MTRIIIKIKNRFIAIDLIIFYNNL